MANTGFILPDWALPHWERNMCHTIEPESKGGFCVVCWDLQETVFVANTRQECVKFLGHDDTDVRELDPARIIPPTLTELLELPLPRGEMGTAMLFMLASEQPTTDFGRTIAKAMGRN